MAEKPVEHLDDLEYDKENSNEHITFQKIVAPGAMGLLSAGRARIKGPIPGREHSHEGWDQVYLVLSGKAKVVVGKECFPIEKGYVIRIPAGINHGVVVGESEELDYCFFNAFRDEEAIQSLVSGK